MRINIRKAGPLIATGLASAGVIVTALLAVKKAPEVQEAVEDARSERGGVLNPIEIVKAAAPSAWPVCAVAAGTIACIIGIQAMNQKQQIRLFEHRSSRSSSQKHQKDHNKSMNA